MSNHLGHLALTFAEDRGTAKARQVLFLSCLSIVLLSLTFGWVTLFALFGASVGITIRNMAARQASAIRREISERFWASTVDRLESRATQSAATDSFFRTLQRFSRTVIQVLSKVFDVLGIVHVALTNRLLPFPITHRA
jgi:hypothetical protein